MVPERVRQLRSQRGASAIELALYTPLMFLIIFVIVQFTLTWHGNQVASAAARQAAREARADGAGQDAIGQAEARGYEYAQVVGNGHLVDIEVEVVQVGDNIRATVSGRSTEIVNNLAPRVSQTVEGPIEQFVPDS